MDVINIMTQVNMAIPPWGNTFSFFLFFKKNNDKEKREEPLRGEWNYYIDMVRSYYFVWNNIVLSKFKKEEVEYIHDLYLNLSLEWNL